MELNGEYVGIAVIYSFASAVVHVDETHLRRNRQRVALHRVSVILRRNVNASGIDVLDRKSVV